METLNMYLFWNDPVEGESEGDATIAFRYTPGDPGRYTGPWENCYPAEPAEVEIQSILHQKLDGSVVNILEYVQDYLQDDQWEDIEIECCAHAERDLGDYDD
jgi:hypothetical protein